MTGLSSLLPSSSSSPPSPSSNPLSNLPTPPKLTPPQTRNLLALACIAATSTRIAFETIPSHHRWWILIGENWVEAVCKMIELNRASLPEMAEIDTVTSMAKDHWTSAPTPLTDIERDEEYQKISDILVLASIFTPPIQDQLNTTIKLPDQSTKTTPTLSYSPPTRALTISTLQILSIPLSHLLTSESYLSESLFKTLQQITDTSSTSQAQVESTRQASSSGWGGSLGRNIATGVGVAIGGIAIGITGGLAAPAIAALIPSFMTFGLLTTATAPVVLGSVFGVAAGGLTGKRVRQRWSGVEEFEFVDVKMGSKPFEDEITYEVRKKKGLEEDSRLVVVVVDDKDMGEKAKREDEVESSMEEKTKTKRLSLDSTTSEVIPTEEQVEKAAERPPSLVATIAVPGLLTVSTSEAISAWQFNVVPHAFSDGRDVYVLRYETNFMLSTGKALDAWITNKFKGYVKKEVIKRTMLYAYFAAVSLPLSVYSMATMGLDNTWMQSQDKARKAGQLLGEVLEKRVQGQRPVILIGSSVGSLTILHALLYLASLPHPHSLPQIVDSAYLISLPSAPTPEEWQKVRSVVTRRVVNGWCGKDLVLAGVVRLHEVLSRATTLNSGIRVAGLGPIEQPGIEDVDLSEVVDGHFDLQVKMSDIVDVLRID